MADKRFPTLKIRISFFFIIQHFPCSLFLLNSISTRILKVTLFYFKCCAFIIIAVGNHHGNESNIKTYTQHVHYITHKPYQLWVWIACIPALSFIYFVYDFCCCSFYSITVIQKQTKQTCCCFYIRWNKDQGQTDAAWAKWNFFRNSQRHHRPPSVCNLIENDRTAP